MPRTKNERDRAELICQRCGCGILDHEERAMQSISGPGVCLLVYWHINDADCVRALVSRVSELESLVALQVVKLDRMGRVDHV